MKHVVLPIIETSATQTRDEENTPIQRYGVFPEYQVVNVGKNGVNVENVAEPGDTPLHKTLCAIYRSVIELTSDRATARAAADAAGEIPKGPTSNAPRRAERPWETVTDAIRKV
jgi:hypothetical protein